MGERNGPRSSGREGSRLESRSTGSGWTGHPSGGCAWGTCMCPQGLLEQRLPFNWELGPPEGTRQVGSRVPSGGRTKELHMKAERVAGDGGGETAAPPFRETPNHFVMWQVVRRTGEWLKVPEPFVCHL